MIRMSASCVRIVWVYRDADAGNVMRPRTAFKLSLRIPPTLDPKPAQARVKEILETALIFELVVDGTRAAWRSAIDSL